ALSEGMSLDGVSVTVGGLEAPIISAQPTAARFQGPFETALGVTAIVSGSRARVVQDPAQVRLGAYPLVPWGLAFLAGATDSAICCVSAIHQDFRSLVTLDNPAQPNEIVHFYTVGLGPVAPVVGTGQPGPSSPPARVTTQFECSWGSPDSGIPVPIA